MNAAPDITTSLADTLGQFQQETAEHMDSAGLPSLVRHHIAAADKAHQRAVNAFPRAQQQAAPILQDQNYAEAYRLQQAAKFFDQAAADADEALEEASTALETARNELLQAMRPGIPSTVSEAAILDRKTDLRQMLSGVPDDRLAHRVAELYEQATKTVTSPSATEAQKADARLTRHVLAGKLDMYLDSRGPNARALLDQQLGTPGQRDFYAKRFKGNADGGGGAGFRTLAGQQDIVRMILHHHKTGRNR